MLILFRARNVAGPGDCWTLLSPELAAASGLGLSTIVDFERARRAVSKEAIAMIRAALERGGVEFIDENGGGPGVRLKKSTKGKGRK